MIWLRTALAACAISVALGAQASASEGASVQIVAATLATITVTSNAAGEMQARGSIRTHRAGRATIELFAPGRPVMLRITCTDESQGGRHGIAQLATNLLAGSAAVPCASWDGPDVFAYVVDVTLVGGASSDAAGSPISSVMLSTWSMVATAT